MVTMVQKGYGKNCGHGAKKVDKMAVMMQKGQKQGKNGGHMKKASEIDCGQGKKRILLTKWWTRSEVKMADKVQGQNRGHVTTVSSPLVQRSGGLTI